MNMEFTRKLPIPKEVKEMYPVSEKVEQIVNERKKELKDIFSGKSNKLLLIVGPCSADNTESVLDYLNRLKKVNDKVKDKIFILPRVYTIKPRTDGLGYKGMLHEPNADGKPDMFEGIIKVRKLHMKVIEETGLTCADEMLYPEEHRYLNDLLTYVAVGARSVENQQHRLTASGLDIPVGMKNPTGGDFYPMMNAIKAAQNKHAFIYRGWEVFSQGNEYAHAIVRGYVNKHGNMIPNYHYEDLKFLDALYREYNLKNPAVIVDCNHCNSGKNPFEQERIIKEVMHYRETDPEMKKLVKGFMVESYIEDGNQKPGEGIYGKSITDACIGWNKTEKLIMELYQNIKKDA